MSERTQTHREILQIENLSSTEIKERFESIENSQRAILKILQGNKPENLSVKVAAINLGVTERTVRNWIIEGKLKAFKIGHKVFIKESDFEKARSEMKSAKYKR